MAVLHDPYLFVSSTNYADKSIPTSSATGRMVGQAAFSGTVGPLPSNVDLVISPVHSHARVEVLVWGSDLGSLGHFTHAKQEDILRQAVAQGRCRLFLLRGQLFTESSSMNGSSGKEERPDR